MNVMKEETLKKILEQTQLMSALTATIAGAAPGSINIDSFKTVESLVQAGLAPRIFAIGDQLICPWTDVATKRTYDWVWDIVHMGIVTTPDGEEKPGMFLQAHYLTPFAIQYDKGENEVAAETTFSADYSYYLKNEDGSFTLQNNITAGDTIPPEVTYYHNAIRDSSGNIFRYGYNRWSHSAYRQWLNSSTGIGKWWEPKHLGDVAPNELKKCAGFLSGFEEDFLSVVKPIKIRTGLNTVTDSADGQYEDTVDLMFLASKEQAYGEPDTFSEGEAWDYYKKVTGLTTPSNANNVGRTKYKLEMPTSAEWYRLRSPHRGNSCHTWNVGAAGDVNYYNVAYYSGRCAPACVIY